MLSPPPAVASNRPSGLNATPDTTPVWPVSGWPCGWPVATSHSRTVRSAPAVASSRPSGLNATSHTMPVWPVSSRDAWVSRASPVISPAGGSGPGALVAGQAEALQAGQDRHVRLAVRQLVRPCGQFAGQSQAGLRLGLVVLLPGQAAGRECEDQQGRDPGEESTQSTVGPAGRVQFPRCQRAAGVQELLLEWAELVGVATRPLVQDGQPSAAQQIGLVTLALAPVDGRAFQLGAQPQPRPVGLDRLPQRWPLPQQRLMGHLNRGLARLLTGPTSGSWSLVSSRASTNASSTVCSSADIELRFTRRRVGSSCPVTVASRTRVGTTS